MAAQEWFYVLGIVPREVRSKATEGRHTSRSGCFGAVPVKQRNRIWQIDSAASLRAVWE
jgi:hypothetical protein